MHSLRLERAANCTAPLQSQPMTGDAAVRPTNRESADGAKGGHFLETTGVRALAVPQAGRSGLLKLAGRGCAQLVKGYRAELMGILGRKGGGDFEFP